MADEAKLVFELVDRSNQSSGPINSSYNPQQNAPSSFDVNSSFQQYLSSTGGAGARAGQGSYAPGPAPNIPQAPVSPESKQSIPLEASSRFPEVQPPPKSGFVTGPMSPYLIAPPVRVPKVPTEKTPPPPKAPTQPVPDNTRQIEDVAKAIKQEYQDPEERFKKRESDIKDALAKNLITKDEASLATKDAYKNLEREKREREANSANTRNRIQRFIQEHGPRMLDEGMKVGKDIAEGVGKFFKGAPALGEAGAAAEGAAGAAGRMLPMLGMVGGIVGGVTVGVGAAAAIAANEAERAKPIVGNYSPIAAQAEAEATQRKTTTDIATAGVLGDEVALYTEGKSKISKALQGLRDFAAELPMKALGLTLDKIGDYAEKIGDWAQDPATRATRDLVLWQGLGQGVIQAGLQGKTVQEVSNEYYQQRLELYRSQMQQAHNLLDWFDAPNDSNTLPAPFGAFTRNQWRINEGGSPVWEPLTNMGMTPFGQQVR